MEQPTVVSVDRWSLYRGELVSLRWPIEQRTVVTVDRWSCYSSSLVERFHCMSLYLVLVSSAASPNCCLATEILSV